MFKRKGKSVRNSAAETSRISYRPFIVARDAGADWPRSAPRSMSSCDDFGVDTINGKRVKMGSSAHTLGITSGGAGVDVSPAVEENASGIEEAIFGSDVEECRATQS